MDVPLQCCAAQKMIMLSNDNYRNIGVENRMEVFKLRQQFPRQKMAYALRPDGKEGWKKNVGMDENETACIEAKMCMCVYEQNKRLCVYVKKCACVTG